MFTFQQLYLPYGGTCYSSGTAPTTRAFTGQRWDSTDGLYYDNARYYDPIAQQFTSADTVADGLNRYGYVAGNPTTNTDPTGHLVVGGDGGGSGPYIMGSILEQFQPTYMGRNSTNHAVIYRIYGRYVWLWSNGTRTYSNSLVTIRTYQTCDAVCIRDRSLDAQAKTDRIVGAIAIALGTLVDVVADIAGIMYGKSATERIGDVLDIGATLISLAPLVALLNASLTSAINFVLAGAHTLVALGRSALAAINKFGPLGEAAVNVAVNAATTLVGGPVGVLQRVLMWAAGPVVNNLLSAGAHALIAFGYYQLGVVQHLIDQEINY